MAKPRGKESPFGMKFLAQKSRKISTQLHNPDSRKSNNGPARGRITPHFKRQQWRREDAGFHPGK